MRKLSEIATSIHDRVEARRPAVQEEMKVRPPSTQPGA
jgi:hypothetical protein